MPSSKEKNLSGVPCKGEPSNTLRRKDIRGLTGKQPKSAAKGPCFFMGVGHESLTHESVYAFKKNQRKIKHLSAIAKRI